MEVKAVSLNEALDLAVAKLPPLRRRVTERRLRNAEYRKSVLDELALKLSDDKDCPCKAMLASETFSADQKMEINLDNLERLLQIIIKYLPTILELVLKFLPLFM
jgi:hypothetical protein